MINKIKENFVSFYRLLGVCISQKRPQTFSVFVVITMLTYSFAIQEMAIRKAELARLEAAEIASSRVRNPLINECPTLNDANFSNSEEIIAAVNEASAVFNVEEELIYAVMIAESRCKNTARSRAGAMGLMQLMPRTAAWLGVKSPYGVRDNIFGGAKYLSHLLDVFDGNMHLALAAYNAGPTKVKRYSSVPPYRETRNYIYRVDGYYQRLRSSI